MCHWKSTPGHGYLILSSAELAELPEDLRRGSYEEDCEWSIAVLALPALLQSPGYESTDPAKELEIARSTCRNWYPDIYERLTGEEATPANSCKRAEDEFNRIHARDWVVICARGDWAEGVPAGYVEGVATMGGERRGVNAKVFYIPAARYDARERFGYVIQAGDLERVGEDQKTLRLVGSLAA